MADVNIGSAPNDGTGDPLRTAFNKLNASINAEASTRALAVSALTSEVRSGRVWTYFGQSPSGSTPPESADTIVTTSGNNSLQIWEWENNPPSAETDTQKKDANNQWWRLEWDSRNIDNQITVLNSTALPKHQTITGESSASLRNANSWTETPSFYTVEGASVSNAPVSQNEPANASVSILVHAGGVRVVWYDDSGDVYSRTYTESVWSTWRREIGVNKTVNASALSPPTFANFLDIYITYTFDGSSVIQDGPNGARSYTGRLVNSLDGNRIKQEFFKGSDDVPFIRYVSGAESTPWRRTALAGSDRKLVVFGDSNAHGVGASDPAMTSFAELTAGATGCTMVKMGTAGAGMSPATSTNQTHIDGSFSRRATASSSELEDTDICVVVYGTNDFNGSVPIGQIGIANEDTFFGAMEIGYASLLEANPAIEVLFLTPWYRSISPTDWSENLSQNSAGHTLQDYRDAILEFCVSKRISHIDMYGRMGVTANNASELLTDGIHANDIGHLRASNILIDNLASGGESAVSMAGVTGLSEILDEHKAIIDDITVVISPQVMGQGDYATVAQMNGETIIAASSTGRIRLVVDDWTLDDLENRLNISGSSAAPVSPSLLGGIDGWSVWLSDDLLTFTSIIEPFDYPREYVMKSGGDAWMNGDPIVPIRLIYGDGLGLAPASDDPERVTQIPTLSDGAGQDGLDGAIPSGPATDITRAGAGFAALSADVALSGATGLAGWIAVRSEAVTGASLPSLLTGQPWNNLVRAKDQFVARLAEYNRTGQLDAVTIMHGAGDDSVSYETDLLSMLAQLEGIGARQINVFVPCGTTERGDFASTLATIEAFRNRGSAPMRLVAPLYPYPRSGLATPTPESVTMLAEMDAYCAADPDWLPPLAFSAVRTGTTVNVDFEVMSGRYLFAPSASGWSYSGANVVSVTVVNDPITLLPTRIAVELDAAASGTLSYAHSATVAEGELRDDWTAPSRTGQPLYRYALPFTFEVI